MKHDPAETEQELMKLGFTWTLVGLIFLGLLLTVTSDAQQTGAPITQNSGQASQPVAGSNGPGRVGSDMPPATQPAANPNPPAPDESTKTNPAPASTASSTSVDDNPY